MKMTARITKMTKIISSGYILDPAGLEMIVIRWTHVLCITTKTFFNNSLRNHHKIML
jgi:hypothetical protein